MALKKIALSQKQQNDLGLIVEKLNKRPTILSYSDVDLCWYVKTRPRMLTVKDPKYKLICYLCGKVMASGYTNYVSNSALYAAHAHGIEHHNQYKSIINFL